MLTKDEYTLIEQIIRVCQARGAILPAEMVAVGLVYQKIVQIIEQAKQTEQQEQPRLPLFDRSDEKSN